MIINTSLPTGINLPEFLTHNLLEYDPEKYLLVLKTCDENNVNITNVLNSTAYKTWYSSHPISLAYLVGNLVSPGETDFYGLDRYITDVMGVELINLMVKCGADLTIKNYYGDTISDVLARSGANLTKRINNDKFKQRVFKLCSVPSNKFLGG